MNARTDPPLNGLVLAGGLSKRMGTNKADLVYGGSQPPQWKRVAELLKPFCRKILISVRPGQKLAEYAPDEFELIEDLDDSKGPLTGLLSAVKSDPDSAWLAVACDLPLLDRLTIQELLQQRGTRPAVAFESANDGLPEPLCALYEPGFFPILESSLQKDILCPRKILIQNEAFVKLIELPNPRSLDNANTPSEFETLSRQLEASKP